MILRIRNSYFGKGTSLILALTILLTTINPGQSFALTGGPAQPEFNSFTPIGTSDMVDLASGDFSYNIPIMDVGGFPLNLAYNSGVTMDDEASWVGLGWNLSIGQINRQMRGLPDDFKGDMMTYENDMKDNYTVGATFQITPNVVGVELDGVIPPSEEGNVTYGVTAQYNSYNGFSLTPSLGVAFDLGENASVGLNIKSDENGLCISPSVSMNARVKKGKNADLNLGLTAGLSFNSRQGLSNLSFGGNTKATRLTANKNGAIKNETIGGLSTGSSISFVDNHYTPSVQNGLSTVNFTFNAAAGTEIFGIEGNGQITAFGSNQFIPDVFNTQKSPAYGYDNNHEAGVQSVRDFNREKDGNFSVNSTNLPLTNYTYDIYSVSGQGVNGMFRPYRSQVGFVGDPLTVSAGGGGALGIEAGGGNLFHVGADIEATVTVSASGQWLAPFGNNAIQYFDKPNSEVNQLYEEVYYKNVGDLAVDEESGMYGTSTTELGKYAPARLQLSGTKFNRVLNAAYEIKSETSPNTYHVDPFSSEFKRDERINRNQNITKVAYDEINTTSGTKLLGFKDNANSKPHHTAGYVVTRNDGARYIYGDALYNTHKEEVTFAVEGNSYNMSTGLVNYSGSDNSLNNSKGDQYFDRVVTGPYAHTYLLTCLLSTDYSDVDNITGPSENDLGSYTLFQYTTPQTYKWRVPYDSYKANFNEGLRTDPEDNKGSYIYGTKEQKYIQKIETKTHVAIFTISPRNDGKGVAGENGGLGSSSMYKLDKISLYSKEEFVQSGTDLNGNITVTSNSTPIKEAHFKYNYSLCPGVPNNSSGGKLTLERVYFTYRNSNMGEYADYNFHYGDANHDGIPDGVRNPAYNMKGYDIWGNYKPNNGTALCNPTDALAAPEFIYTEQDNPDTDNYASAWSLTDIDLPSGGKIQVDYEADDYQYVQDQKAMQNFQVVGAGPDANPTTSTSYLFVPNDNNNALLFKAGNNHDLVSNFLYFKIPNGLSFASDAEYRESFLKDIIDKQNSLVQFRFMLNMNHEGGKDNSWSGGDFEYVSGYFKLKEDVGARFPYGGNQYGSIGIELVNLEGGFGGASDANPISKAGWQFGRKYLSKYIYGLPGDEDNLDPSAIVNSVILAFENLLEIFQGPNGLLRSEEIGRRFITHKSWIRLGNPTGHKKGGGCRVNQLVMTDEWAEMTKNEEAGSIPDDTRDQKYGQIYSYNLEDGTSSGVATYEPAGSKENPLVQPVFVNEKRLLAPDEENYMEKPFGESFYPSPAVTYSRVSVKNLERFEDFNDVNATNDLIVRKHATGEVVTEFYTSKDYPVIADQTELIVHEDKTNPLLGLLNIHIKKHISLSQGYVVHVNDMNGKMKSQRVYAEGQETAISGVDYVYDGYSETVSGSNFPDDLLIHNEGRINNNVKTLSPDGKIEENTLGVEYDVINDFRQMRSETGVLGVNTNVATFLIGFFPGIIPMPLPDVTVYEDDLKMAVTTKVINTFGVQREVIAYDAGASVYTRNLLWDESTGEVLLTETVNEYGDKYYSLNFPAHWYYDGMGMACENAGAIIQTTNLGSGLFDVFGSQSPLQIFHEGDEVLLGNGSTKQYGWVHSITGTSFKIMDKDGIAITTIAGGELKIIRSGKRNLQSSSMASIVLMKNPLNYIPSTNQLPPNFLASNTWSDFLIVNAGAVEFNNVWDLQCECGIENTSNPANPWRSNQKGVWRALRSHLYLTGRHHNSGQVNPRYDGFYNSFSPFYYIDGSGNWHINSAGWTFTSEVSKFSQFGFEIENKDALNRYSAAQYGYSFTFPMAVAANARYAEIGYDGFEDYSFEGCDTNEHFGFRDVTADSDISAEESHTGKHSLKVAAGQMFSKIYPVACQITQPEP